MAFVARKAPTLIIGLVLVVILCFLWSTGLVCGQEEGSGPTNLDVILLIDNSQSMSDTSDPGELRIRTAQRIVDRLSEHAETFNLCHRAGVVSFGIGVTRTIQLKELPNNTVRNGISAEKIPGSDFREPLDTALQQFRDYSFGTGNHKAVLLFTDGHPQLREDTLTKEELEAYFSDRAEEVLQDGKGNLTDRIRQLETEDVQIFIVATGDTDEDHSNWTGLSSEIRYLRLRSSTDVDSVVDSVVDQLIAVTIPSPTVPRPTMAPTSTSTPVPSPTPTSTPTSTPTPTSIATATPTSTPTPTATPTPVELVDLIELLQLGEPILSPTRPRAGQRARLHVPVTAARAVTHINVMAQVRDGTRVVTTTMLRPETNGFGGELRVLTCRRWYLPTCPYTVLVLAEAELPGGLVLLRQREAVMKVRPPIWWYAALAILVVGVAGVFGGLAWRHRYTVSTIRGRLQLGMSNAAQTLVSELRGKRWIVRVLSDKRLQRLDEELGHRYAMSVSDVERLYAEVRRRVQDVKPQELKAPEQLDEIREELNNLRRYPSSQLEERIRTARTASNFAGAEILLFEKCLSLPDRGAVTAIGLLKDMAGRKLEADQIAAGWCLALLVERGKMDLYLDVFRERGIPFQVREYAALVGEFLQRGG